MTCDERGARSEKHCELPECHPRTWPTEAG